MENPNKEFLTGNEGVARGAYEACASFAVGYPGTPSTEILETIASRYRNIKSQWAVNEKTALEIAAGASFCGARTIITMKHIGLNVALDPLMTLSYLGIKGGLIVAVSDDPGQHSSQNEQDTRHLARFAKIPVFEPSDSQEAKDFVKTAFEVSEKFDTPVIMRLTTRISHSKGIVSFNDKEKLNREYRFERNPRKYVPVPIYGRLMRRKVEDRITALKKYGEDSPINTIEYKSTKLGIITSSIAYEYAAEVFPEASFLKLGMCYPFPDRLFYEFASNVEKVLVIEELEDFMEEHVHALGITNVWGKEFIPICGELSLGIVKNAKRRFCEKFDLPFDLPEETQEGNIESDLKTGRLNLPVRAPVLCSGCPHTGLFYALKKERKKDELIVAGDIGCYSLAVFAPLDIMDTIVCMGGGFTVALGMKASGTKQKIVGVLGDSTFFHSGITGLIDAVYNQSNVTLIILDNHITAMTGHQDNPGTGKNIFGEIAGKVSIQEIVKASGVKLIKTVDPLNLKETREALKEVLAFEGTSVLITKHSCKFIKFFDKPRKHYIIDPEKCRGCMMCLELGCPALERVKAVSGEKPARDKVTINPALCDGCSLCSQVCKFGTIEKA